MNIFGKLIIPRKYNFADLFYKHCIITYYCATECCYFQFVGINCAKVIL